MVSGEPMSESDLLRFLDKVDQLQQLVRSLDTQPERRDALADCSNHNQVVQLAQSWGFEIGRRWGESPIPQSVQENLLTGLSAVVGTEEHARLHQGLSWHLDLIHSNGFASAEEEWFDQDTHEWVAVLRGSARLQFQDQTDALDLSAGDHLYLAPHRLHRVLRTDPDPGTLWLALHWHV